MTCDRIVLDGELVWPVDRIVLDGKLLWPVTELYSMAHWCDLWT